MTAPSDDGYELFQRAIVQRDAEAWAAIHVRYQALLISWAYSCGGRAAIEERYDDIADQALAKAWSALTPDRFASFSSLPRLLGYLRACVSSVVVDSVRARAAGDRALSIFDASAGPTPEVAVLAELDRESLWSLVMDLVTDPAERVVLVESCVHGMPPRRISGRHPRLFADVRAVYATKRNLFQRLQRSPALQRLREEYISC